MVAALAACGDNSKECGPGTEDVDGVCTGGGVGTCSDGTILVDDHCEIDPNACQGGTVLMGGACVDPGAQATDIEEAAEPNALGLGGEDSNAPAGEIALKPVGEHFTIHGKIIPFQDADGDGQQDADFDSYELTVSGPTMISVTADGVNGLAGGFVAVAAVANPNDPLAAWTRFGVNPTGDTSQRQVYLPVAGTYVIAIADSRSLFLTGAAPGAGEGQPDMEYFITVDQQTATPTALTATGGVASSQGQLAPGEVKLFSVAMGEGVNSAELDVGIDQVEESLVVVNTRSGSSTTKAVANGDDPDAGDPAATAMIGFRTTDTTLVVVDSVFDYANAPYDYDLTLSLGSAGALSTSGDAVAQPVNPGGFTAFYYDVTDNSKVIGMDLAFDRAVSGYVIDEDGFIFSDFTYLPFFNTFDGSFTSYLGMLRHQVAGRYYFLVFDPNGGTDDIVATSTWEGLTPATITKDTALTNQMVNAYNSTPFTYAPDVATDPWQLFTVSGTGGTGTIFGDYYDPDSAVGRLDFLDVSNCSFCFDDSPLPIFSHSYAEAGQGRGRILLDDNTQQYFVKMAASNGAGSLNMTFTRRQFTDLATVPVGMNAMEPNQALDNTTTVQRYLVRTPLASTVTVTATPQLTVDPRIQQLSTAEGNLDAAINGGIAGGAETWTQSQAGHGWTAFQVTSATSVLGGTFTLDVNVTDPKYAKTSGTTAFSDACNGGTVVAMSDTDEGRSTSTLTAPAGFDLFGTGVTDFNVFSNGFLTFDTAVACAATGSSCFFTNGDLSLTTSPNAIVAPYWDDIIVNNVCQKTVGTKLTIQWDGELFETGELVRFQAILDGSNDTIEFVYDNTVQQADGSSATIGIEDRNGVFSHALGVNAAGTSHVLLTPM